MVFKRTQEYPKDFELCGQTDTPEKSRNKFYKTSARCKHIVKQLDVLRCKQAVSSLNLIFKNRSDEIACNELLNTDTAFYHVYRRIG